MKKLILTLSVLCASHFSFAKTDLKIATVFPDSRFQTQNVHFFAKTVNEQLSDKINITVHSGQSLYKKNEIFSKVMQGDAAMGELMMSSLSKYDPVFEIDSLPFIVRDYTDAQKLWEASRERVSAVLEEKGIILLYAVAWPGQNFYSATPIEDASYFQDKKMPAYNKIMSSIAKELGATEATFDTNYELVDIPQAFADKKIDVLMNSGAYGAFSKAWNFSKYYTQVNAFFPKNMVFINKSIWDELDENTQKTIKNIAQKAEQRGWELSQKVIKEKEALLAEKGMIISDPSTAFKQNLSKIGKRIVKKWIDGTSQANRQVLEDYRGY